MIYAFSDIVVSLRIVRCTRLYREKVPTDRKAQVETRRADLLRVAEKRFVGSLQEEDRQMLATQESPPILEAWFNAALDSDDYAKFRAELRR